MSVTLTSKPRVIAYLPALLAVAMFGVVGCSSNIATQEPDAAGEADPVVLNSGDNADQLEGASEPNLMAFDFDLDIEDQQGEGRFVLIESVTAFDQDVHVVITDADGIVLGQAISTPDRQLVSVVLDKKLSQSQELFGKLYRDDGDGKFSVEVDSQLVDDDGELVEEDFDYTIVESIDDTTSTS